MMNGTLPARRTNGDLGKGKSSFSAILESRIDTIRAVLPKHMTPERLIKIASIALTKTPKLQECSPLSLYASVIKAAELGLDCSGTLGSAYLVPFKGECTLIIGYRGLVDLCRRSNQIVSIEARVVYQNDLFDLSYGTDGKITHKPVIDDEPGDFRLVYGVAHLVGGGIQTEVMTRTQVDRIRNSSRGYDPNKRYGPWHEHYEEMARKTVVRRLCKYLPMSVEVQNAIAAEEDDGGVVDASTPVKPHLDLNGSLDCPAPDAAPNAQSPHFEDDSQLTEAERAAAIPQNVNTETGEVTEQPAQTSDDDDDIQFKELAESLSGDWSAHETRLRKDFVRAGDGRSPAEFIKLMTQKLGIVPKNSTPEQRAKFAMWLGTARAQ